MIGKRDLEVMRKVANKDMYSPLAQSVRIEWETISGGVLKESFQIYEGGTKTEHVQDTQAIIISIDPNRSNIKQLDSAILTFNPVIIKIETDINLKNSPNFIIAQKLTTEEWGTRSGIGASAVWTPEDVPNWTVDQYKGHWLWFSDRRFEIISNTAIAVTVELRDQVLPTALTGADIIEVQEWFPVMNNPSLSDGLRTTLGTEQLWQTILCTQLPVPGDQI